MNRADELLQTLTARVGDVGIADSADVAAIRDGIQSLYSLAVMAPGRSHCAYVLALLDVATEGYDAAPDSDLWREGEQALAQAREHTRQLVDGEVGNRPSPVTLTQLQATIEAKVSEGVPVEDVMLTVARHLREGMSLVDAIRATGALAAVAPTPLCGWVLRAGNGEAVCNLPLGHDGQIASVRSHSGRDEHGMAARWTEKNPDAYLRYPEGRTA